ncbi:amino acid adenylation domain-containing protein [Ktedonosporobacter rubrisoli]|uniref:Amino acid adenylation domain-containing protein n=1 Tax=Ktedonosporobacter rubrisoli TaxID=2509675 RepID=A0A4V0YYS6_KTERU|nr:non-ribosomal peptide synthetase [Ktedonosporobacter rubrisoli]QBD77251.1 amino acid adenylation domain-containing protein [Ktedonosporobacter rubrisoli]
MTDRHLRIAALPPEKRHELLQKLAERKQQQERSEAKLIHLGRQTRSFPLSFAQQRLWFLDQLIPASPLYTIPYAVRISGLLEPEILRASLQQIVERHESLRTRFITENGQVRQIIDEYKQLSLTVSTLEGTPEQQAQIIQQQLLAEVRRPFDLEHGPLIRASLLQTGPAEYILQLPMHHIISDGWSNAILMRELMEIYTSLLDGRDAKLDPLAVQYPDFAVWQRQWLQGSLLDQQLTYWQKQLAGVPEAMDLPIDHPYPAQQTYRGALERLRLPVPLVKQMRAACQREEVTLFMFLLTAFQVLLARYTRQDDIVVGTDVANRSRRETEQLVGFFVNQLVLRTDLSNNPTFRQALKRVREVALGAYAHQDMPFDKLVEILQPERDLRHHPLFQVSFVLQNTPNPFQQAGNLSIQPLEINSGIAKLALDLTIDEKGDELALTLRYQQDIFEAGTMQRMLAHYQQLLQSAVEHGEDPIASLNLLTPSERHNLLYRWNVNEGIAEENQHCYHELFEQQVERTPEARAVIDGDLEFTYAQVNRLANRQAHRLQDVGVEPGVLVALGMTRGISLLLSILAVFKSGGAYLPLETTDPAERLVGMLKDSGSQLLLTTRALAPTLDEVCQQGQIAPRIMLVEDLLAVEQRNTNLTVTQTPRDLAYIIYTSGSTGRPKGVMIEQEGMLNHLRAKVQILHLDEHDIVPQTASHCFDISIWQFLAALLVGGTVQIFPDTITQEPQQLLPRLDQAGVTLLEAVPSVLQVMLDTAMESGDGLPTLASMRWLISTGETLPVQLCRRWQQRYPAIPVINTYGATECSDDTAHHIQQQLLGENELQVPLGLPIAGARQYVLDQELQPVPVGIIGEVYLGGIPVGRGYVGDPVRTAAAFLPDPFSTRPGTRLYKTGDLARLQPDGNPLFAGRIDDQVKIHGHRIELSEIEAVLASHPCVRECTVIIREDMTQDKELAAYIVPERGQTLCPVDELRSYLQRRLPNYMLPTGFVELTTLPLTSNGKLNRRALPKPERMAIASTAAFLPPRNDVEEVIAGIWSEILQVEHIGRTDNFFALGGHSLLATRIIAQVRAVFRIPLPLRVLFEQPTVEKLASILVDQEPVPGQVEKIARLMKQVEQMSIPEKQKSLEPGQGKENE